MDRPKSRLAPILVAAALLCPMLYAAGYVGLGEEHERVKGPDRIYRTRWQARLFIPAAVVEAKARGIQVQVGFGNPVDGFQLIFKQKG